MCVLYKRFRSSYFWVPQSILDIAWYNTPHVAKDVMWRDGFTVQTHLLTWFPYILELSDLALVFHTWVHPFLLREIPELSCFTNLKSLLISTWDVFLLAQNCSSSWSLASIKLFNFANTLGRLPNTSLSSLTQDYMVSCSHWK